MEEDEKAKLSTRDRCRLYIPLLSDETCGAEPRARTAAEHCTAARAKRLPSVTAVTMCRTLFGPWKAVAETGDVFLKRAGS